MNDYSSRSSAQVRTDCSKHITWSLTVWSFHPTDCHLFPWNPLGSEGPLLIGYYRGRKRRVYLRAQMFVLIFLFNIQCWTMATLCLQHSHTINCCLLMAAMSHWDQEHEEELMNRAAKTTFSLSIDCWWRTGSNQRHKNWKASEDGYSFRGKHLVFHYFLSHILEFGINRHLSNSGASNDVQHYRHHWAYFLFQMLLISNCQILFFLANICCINKQIIFFN